MKRFLRIASAALALCAAALVLNGCAGYHVGPIPPKFMDGVHTVAVPTFHNQTLLPRVEVLAADSVIKELQRDGTFKVTSADTADVIIQGTITNLDRHQARALRSDVSGSREFTLTVSVDYTITKRDTQEELDSGSVRGSTSFFVSGNDVNQDERQAIPLAMENAAVHLVTQVTEGW